MATIIVTTAGDVVDGSDGVLSLREAIAQANANADADTIVFDASLSGQTITLTGGAPILTQDVTIDGDVNGDDKADITISGNNASRVFLMTGASTDVDLLSLTLTNGSWIGFGGAIYAQDISTLDIEDTTIRNSVSGSGGGLAASATDVTLTNSLVTGNSTNGFGGGIYVRSLSTLVVTNSTIAGNTTNYYGGGLTAANSTVTLLNSTVTGNQADANGTGTTNGGGIENYRSTITVINSVVAENTSGTSMTANDVRGTIDTATNSVFGTAVTITANTNSLTSVTDVGLGALADNGGTVLTRNITADSVLINTGGTTSLTTDANGNDRVVAGTVDVGATEFQLVVTTASDVVADDGLLSLREAIALANANADADTIVFDASLAGQTIVLTSGELTLTQDVTIDGDTDGDDKADITISGNNASRVFSATGDFTDVDLLSLTLANGNISSTGSGGAIIAQSISTLDIQDTTIKDSAALKGGGVASFGTAVTLTNSLLTGNAATLKGGGIYLMTASTLTVTNSTIHGNTANQNGGGIYASLSSVDLLNSTVTGNQADADGGGTAAGGGIDDFLSTITVINSVVAENTSGTSMTANDDSGTIDTATNSVFGTAVTITANTNSLTSVTGAGLGALADNGGTVMTRNIESGSVLINAGDNASAAALATDANGNNRISFGKVDVGATEFTGPFVVDEAGDTVDGDISAGHLSLREAVALANTNADASTITFDASLAGQTITLTGGELVLTQDVTIDGDTDGDHKADITISGNNASRVFRMTGASTDVDLLSLTLTNGYSNGDGGAVYASSIGTLDIQDTTISDSSARWGGGLNVRGTDVTLANSLVTGNTANYGGGIYAWSLSTLTVTNSTIHGNTANSSGGGISAGISTVTLVNSTVTGNQADADGSVTTDGGGIYNFISTITVINSVVAENTSGTLMTANDVSGTIDTADHSFFGTTVTTGSGSGNLNGAGDPMLGELLDNGGTVLTLSPLDGSPLIGAGSNALLPADVFDIDHDGDTTETLPLDGRDGLRLVGGTVDIGTVEQIADEVINGTPGRNIVIGGLGVDILNGRGGRDTVRGGDDDDTVYGGRGVDLVSGNGGRDKLNGGKGEDTLNGG
ncbi:MAG: hypothetical protein KDK75_06375, partial [Alphaproteobacteria bacterium]|nr:hypothetical protein [Alphaproteobacteria bacterium]